MKEENPSKNTGEGKSIFVSLKTPASFYGLLLIALAAAVPTTAVFFTDV